MNDETTESCLHLALEHLEVQLESPVVPGELREWLQATAQTLAVFRSVLRSHVQDRHRELIEEIAAQDPGLLPRVERLKTEDQAILAESERLYKMISPMAEHSERLEPDEGRAGHAMEKIVCEGLSLVIRVRKQEAALDTWLLEAFDRDRGVAD